MKRFFLSLITEKKKKALFLPVFYLLIPASLIYGLCVVLIKQLYSLKILKKYRPLSKVISIGNISWGGTGKTPLVRYLAGEFSDEGKKTAVLIRGYGSDEDRMLEKNLTNSVVLSGPNRCENAKLAHKKFNADIIILDDGFQHWKLIRDIDIVAINATNPFGNKHLIPAGILREPLSSLKKADIIVITKVNLVQDKDLESLKGAIKQLTCDKIIFESQHIIRSFTNVFTGEIFNKNIISGKKLTVFCGLGDNASFIAMLGAAKAELKSALCFIDHHKYTKYDTERIINNFKKTNSEYIVTTDKDWQRINSIFKEKFSKFPVLILNLKIEIKNEEIFKNRIRSLLDS